MTQVRGNGNRLITPDIIAMEFLMRLMNALVLPKLGRFDYAKYFEDAIGNRLTIKKPYYAFITKERELTSSQINPMVDEMIEIDVDKRYKGALKWNDVELTLDINQFSERYLDSLVEQLGYRFDQDAALALARGIFMIQGTPGTALTQDKVPDVRAYWNEAGVPMDGDNFGLINPVDAAQIQKDLAGGAGQPGKFNESMVRRNIERWFRGELSGFNMFESIHIPDLVVERKANQTEGFVNGAGQTGDTLATDGWGVNNTRVLRKGQLITIAGVRQTYPRSWDEDLAEKLHMGRGMVFAVAEDAVTNGAGAANVKIIPEINDGTLTRVDSTGTNVLLKAFQNVDNAPADDAVMAVLGWPDAVRTDYYRQNLFFHRRALHFVPIMLAELKSAVHQYTAVDPQTNLSIAALQYLDGAKREETLRLDSFYGVKNIYPELGVRYVSTKRA